MSVSAEYLEGIVQSIPDPIFVKDRKLRWVFVNDAFCRFMGCPRAELLGKTDFDFFSREQAEVFRQKEEEVFASGRESAGEEKMIDVQGRPRAVFVKKSRYSERNGSQYLIGFLRDVAGPGEARPQTSGVLKTDVSASMAGGIAHDLNNQLTPIMGYLDLALHELPASSPIRALIEEAKQAASRCADTVERLRSVGRSSPAASSGDLPVPKGKDHETVLLADDEEAVRRLGRTLLEKLGYRVFVASDGDEAVDRFRSTRGIALVILDVVMPRMGGEQALRRILEIDPSARVLISSGYMMDMQPEDFIRQGARGFLKKPYLLEPLAKLVRDTLDRPA